jgi:hypothetical protein
MPVTNGLFAVALNATGEFGAFTGEARWLQTTVRCTGDSSFMTLSPRQVSTAVLYVLHATGIPQAGNGAAAPMRTEGRWLQLLVRLDANCRL